MQPGKIQQGQRIAEPVSLLDVAPTILAQVEIGRPKEFTGLNMLKPLPDDRPIYLQRRKYKSEYVRGQGVPGELAGIVASPTKLVLGPEASVLEVYDLDADAAEADNIAKQEPEQTERLLRC